MRQTLQGDHPTLSLVLLHAGSPQHLVAVLLVHTPLRGQRVTVVAFDHHGRDPLEFLDPCGVTGQSNGSRQSGTVFLVVDERRIASVNGLENMGRRRSVNHSAPPIVTRASQDDLVLDTGQGRLAADRLVPQRLLRYRCQHASHVALPHGLIPRGLGFAGHLRIPDLERSCHVVPELAEQTDNVMLLHSSGLRQSPRSTPNR